MGASLERALVLARQYRPLAAIEVLDALPTECFRTMRPMTRQMGHVLSAWCRLEINDVASARSIIGRIDRKCALGGGWRDFLEARLATHAGEYATALVKLNRAARRCAEDDVRCLSMGKLGRAEQHLERAAAIAASLRMKKSLPHVQLGVARMHRLRGAAVQCRQAAGKAATSFHKRRDYERESEARLLCAEAHALQHDWREASLALR